MVKNYRRILFVSVIAILLLVGIRIFYSLDSSSPEILKLRLIRICALLFCGGAIAISGFVLQNVFRNPIVDIYILGNAGIGILSQIVSAVLFKYPANYAIHYLLSIILNFIFMVAIYRFATAYGYFDLVKLLLLSFSLNIFIWGGINFLAYNTTKLGFNIMEVIAGGIEGISYIEVIIIVFTLTFVFIWLFNNLDRIEIFSIGEEFAIASGVSPEKLKLEVFVIISIVATVVTATVGIVPFIGIIIPYFVKTLFKGSIYKHFFVVLICGALILLISDFVSLVISSYLRLPVFVLLNLFGFPFFVYLIWKR